MSQAFLIWLRDYTETEITHLLKFTNKSHWQRVKFWIPVKGVNNDSCLQTGRSGSVTSLEKKARVYTPLDSHMHTYFSISAVFGGLAFCCALMTSMVKTRIISSVLRVHWIQSVPVVRSTQTSLWRPANVAVKANSSYFLQIRDLSWAETVMSPAVNSTATCLILAIFCRNRPALGSQHTR